MSAHTVRFTAGPIFAVLAGVSVVAALAAVQPGWWVAFQGWVRLQQLQLQGQLGDATKASLDASAATLWALVSLSFIYGVLHAVGPGHGKAVIATYAATSRATARKVARLSFLASLTQAAAAILLVYGALSVLQLSARWATRTAETVLEPASYGAIALLGGYLVWRGWSVWLDATAGRFGRHHDHDDDHHDHHHAHNHDHHHEHLDYEAQVRAHGHSHGPDPRIVEGASDIRAQVGAILAIGVRPCSGALIVLAIAWGLGAAWTGVLAALAMGAGTGITVAALSIMAVGARELALKATALDTESAGRFAGAMAMAGGALIAAFAGLMLWNAINQPAHPFLS